MEIEIRSAITSFAMLPSEKKILSEFCSDRGMRMSDYIRKSVLDQIKKDQRKEQNDKE